MDPRRLMVFREVARAGSLAGAARALGWTQPAVSQQIKRFETENGTPLVVRQGRGVVLTEAGRVLLVHAEAVADRLAAAEQEVAALAGLGGGVVRLAAFPSVRLRNTNIGIQAAPSRSCATLAAARFGTRKMPRRISG